MSNDTGKGAGIYSPLVLKLYDWWVLGISNHYAWECPTRDVLLPFFRLHSGRHHLDVGVGTGYYFSKADLPASALVTLMDLNLSSLQAAQRRLNRPSTKVIQHDVMTPPPSGMEATFDAISLFYLLHCLPGTMDEKAAVFAHLKPLLRPSGVLYGATILGDEVGHNRMGRKLMDVYNRKGIFGNRHDTRNGLERALQEHFAEVTIRVEGKVALFEARWPML
ncbi:class I SAM-dependent methyltransferase [Dyella koreensis]|uniref:Class I SAM-dependent methyltransferase n=1 Tax=Dyella koreensis TaxID=311235 RepID=A0ABW8K4T6_9GAMM